MDDFPEINLPGFDTAPKPQFGLSPLDKGPAAEALRIGPEDSSRLFYMDGSGDFEFFKYGRLANVPRYKPATSSVLGLQEERWEPPRDVKVEYNILRHSLPLYSKAVKNTLSKTVCVDPSDNIILMDYEDSLILNVYDPELLRKDESRAASEAISKDIHDVDGWIELSRILDANLSIKGNLEKRQMILERALDANPGNLRLIKEFVEVYGQAHSAEETVRFYRKLADRYRELLPEYFQFRLRDARSFNLHVIQEEFEGLDSFKFIEFLFLGGYTERAIRSLEYLSKIRYRGLASSRWLYDNDMLCYSTDPVDLLMIPPSVQSESQAIIEWLSVEAYRSFKFACPRSASFTYQDEQEEDPDRVVVYEDVAGLTYKPRLADMFELFGFDDSIPRPFILCDYICYEHLRKVQAISTLPPDLCSVLLGMCWDMLGDCPLEAAFHYLLLGGATEALDLDNDKIADASIVYLVCQKRFSEARAIYEKCARPDSSSLYAELLLKEGLDVPFELTRQEPFHTFMSRGPKAMLTGLQDSEYWHKCEIFSLLIYAGDKILLSAARQWLLDHFEASRFAFDAFVQFEMQYCSGYYIRRARLCPDDYQLYVLACTMPELAAKYSSALETPMQAIQMVLSTTTNQDCLSSCYQAINRFPGVKQVYMAAIDKLCSFSDHHTALSILSVMEERGLRIRALLEELL